MYDEYEKLVNERLDNIDRLMDEMINAANANTDRIQNEISMAADKVGYAVTEAMQTAMGGYYAHYDRSSSDEPGIDASGAANLMNSIYDNVNKMAAKSGAVSAYVRGNPYTASDIGTQSDSELSQDVIIEEIPEELSPDVIIEEIPEDAVEGFLQAAQMMQNMTDLAPKSTQGFGEITGSGSIGDITMNVSIDHVQDYNDFVTQLQGDPKFEKLIDAMTINKMLGGSKLAKNGIRF